MGENGWNIYGSSENIICGIYMDLMDHLCDLYGFMDHLWDLMDILYYFVRFSDVIDNGGYSIAGVREYDM